MSICCVNHLPPSQRKINCHFELKWRQKMQSVIIFIRECNTCRRSAVVGQHSADISSLVAQTHKLRNVYASKSAKRYLRNGDTHSLVYISVIITQICISNEFRCSRCVRFANHAIFDSLINFAFVPLICTLTDWSYMILFYTLLDGMQNSPLIRRKWNPQYVLHTQTRQERQLKLIYCMRMQLKA